MLRTLIFSLIVLSLSQYARAAGPYDGIWQAPSIGYFFTFHENNGQVALITLSPHMEWEAWLGSANGNQGSVDTIVSSVSSHVEYTITSATTMSFYQTSCYPAYDCVLPNSVTINANKIW